MEEQKEVLEVVTDLNDEMYERVGLDYLVPFEFKSIGLGGCSVTFMGITIWHSDFDQREWLNDETQEPYRDYLIRESNKILKDLILNMGALLWGRRLIHSYTTQHGLRRSCGLF